MLRAHSSLSSIFPRSGRSCPAASPLQPPPQALSGRQGKFKVLLDKGLGRSRMPRVGDGGRGRMEESRERIRRAQDALGKNSAVLLRQHLTLLAHPFHSTAFLSSSL